MDAHKQLITQIEARFPAMLPAEVARQLGVSQSFWWKVRHDRKRLGLRTLNRIRTQYPDLAGSAIAVLLDALPQTRCGEAETASRGGGGRKRQARSTTALIGGQDS